MCTAWFYTFVVWRNCVGVARVASNRPADVIQLEFGAKTNAQTQIARQFWVWGGGISANEFRTRAHPDRMQTAEKHGADDVTDIASSSKDVGSARTFRTITPVRSSAHCSGIARVARQTQHAVPAANGACDCGAPSSITRAPHQPASQPASDAAHCITAERLVRACRLSAVRR